MTDLNLTEKIIKEFNAQFVGVDQYGLIKTCRPSDVKIFLLKAISQTAESLRVEERSSDRFVEEPIVVGEKDTIPRCKFCGGTPWEECDCSGFNSCALELNTKIAQIILNCKQ